MMQELMNIEKKMELETLLTNCPTIDISEMNYVGGIVAQNEILGEYLGELVTLSMSIHDNKDNLFMIMTATGHVVKVGDNIDLRYVNTVEGTMMMDVWTSPSVAALMMEIDTEEDAYEILKTLNATTARYNVKVEKDMSVSLYI